MTTHGKERSWSRRAALIALAAAALGCARDAVAPTPAARSGVSAQLGPFSSWSYAERIELAPPGAHPSINVPTFNDGCPVASRDGKTLFFASNRPDGQGNRHGIDIYAARRERVDEPWGEPVRLAEPINSDANDFCPMPARDGHEFYFVSNRVIPGVSCGGDDIYVTRFRDDGTIDPPENLGCDVNSAGNEAGPVPITEPGRGPVLYFSSTRAGGFVPEPPGALPDADLYASEWQGGRYGAAALVPGVNSGKDDVQPYIQRDALELYFSSTRGGNADIWMASRDRAHDAWSTPVNLGDHVNSGASETRPSLSWDGTTLYFGSTRGGGDNNVYVSVRERPTGQRP
jgi:hypothetical protein